jgi:signal transduction histidine kinase
MLLRNSVEVGERHLIEVQVAATDIHLDADENQVRQIVWNLATNGLRAMRDGGTLTLSAAPEDSGSGAAVLTVEDEGIGMTPEEIDGLFHPFRGSFQKGSGLGLAIVHRIVSDYGATINVQSAPRRGTIFRVVFPPATLARVAAGAGTTEPRSRDAQLNGAALARGGATQDAHP